MVLLPSGRPYRAGAPSCAATRMLPVVRPARPGPLNLEPILLSVPDGARVGPGARHRGRLVSGWTGVRWLPVLAAQAGVGPWATPTTGARRARPPVDPSKGASPNAKMPPSEAASQ